MKMDDLNLIKFNSPNPTEIMDSNTDDPFFSPGTNPFDSLFKDLNSVNVPLQDNTFIKLSTPSEVEDFFKYPVDIQHFGRESLATLKSLDISPGKESLGILKLEALNASFNTTDDLNIPNICLPSSEEQHNLSNNPLNTAFLYSVNSRKPSVVSNNSNITNPSFFNSASLDASELSNIYLCNSNKTYDVFSKSEDLLNDAFLSVGASKLSINGNELNIDNVTRKRAQSTVEGNKTNDGCEDIINYVGFRRSCWSVPEMSTEYESPLIKRADHSNIQEDESFNNSVFIEANFIASKLADGSIFDENFATQDVLDGVGLPNFSIIDQIEVDNSMYNKILSAETRQDQDDNGSPDDPTSDNVSNKQSFSYSQKDVNNLNEFYESKESHKSLICSKNESYSQKFANSQGSNSNCSSKSKNANELLQNLSEIINNEDRDPKQKREGQQLLSGLASILCYDSSKVSSNKLESSEDSGHSSIEQEEQHNEQDLPVCYQGLDLRTATSKSDNEEKVLDLSMKSKSVQSCNNKRSSQSFSFPSSKQSSVKLLAGLKAGPSIKSSTSLDSKKDQCNREVGKLKPKRIEQKVNTSRKGPLKAVIPLGSMAKSKSFANKTHLVDSTPPKVEKSTTVFKTKRTSTPIADPPIKPMAQSTPDNRFEDNMDTKPISCSSQMKKPKFYCPISPLVKPPSIGNMSSDSEWNKSNRSGSAPNLSNVLDNSKKNSHRNSLIPSPKTMHRRHSATELKVSNNNISSLKRSYSIGKETRSSITNRRSSISKDSPTVKKQNALHERNTGTVTTKTKLLNSFGKLRKSVTNNKENVVR